MGRRRRKDSWWVPGFLNTRLVTQHCSFGFDMTLTVIYQCFLRKDALSTWTQMVSALLHKSGKNTWLKLAVQLQFQADQIRVCMKHDNPCLAMFEMLFNENIKNIRDGTFYVWNALQKMGREDAVAAIHDAISELTYDLFIYYSPNTASHYLAYTIQLAIWEGLSSSTTICGIIRRLRLFVRDF